MEEQEFYDRVASRASFESEGEALAITHATLEAFSERISEGQARDLTDDLPRPIAESLTHHHGNPAELSLEEVVERIESHDEVDADLEARDERIAAVLGTLAEATGEGFEDLRAQLPSEFEELIESGESGREVES
jgi:uncharacterized protein (DUF2267 family)